MLNNECRFTDISNEIISISKFTDNENILNELRYRQEFCKMFGLSSPKNLFILKEGILDRLLPIFNYYPVIEKGKRSHLDSIRFHIDLDFLDNAITDYVSHSAKDSEYCDILVRYIHNIFCVQK